MILQSRWSSMKLSRAWQLASLLEEDRRGLWQLLVAVLAVCQRLPVPELEGRVLCFSTGPIVGRSITYSAGLSIGDGPVNKSSMSDKIFLFPRIPLVSLHTSTTPLSLRVAQTNVYYSTDQDTYTISDCHLPLRRQKPMLKLSCFHLSEHFPHDSLPANQHVPFTPPWWMA